MAQKIYLNKTVYEAFLERMDFIFAEFENIVVSFSGGKDSGLLLNLVMRYMAERGITRRIGLFHQDFEAQYEKTTEFVTRTFAAYADRVEPYWCCLPMAVESAVSNYDIYWYPWNPDEADLWVRDMPTYPHVVNLINNPFDFYTCKMEQSALYKQFGRWYKNTHGKGKTVTLLGLRADESLHRYSGFINKKYGYDGKKWITSNHKDVWSASPLYDWTVQDVWTANGKFGFDYNRLYDLYYKAGVSLDKMRVASPFHRCGTETLNLYRILEPQTWAKIVGRAKGANFGAIYGGTKALGYREVTLPAGHSWKSYTEFLLSTLPEALRENYLEKFRFSMEFWAKTGGGFAENVIREIEACGYRIRRNGVSNYTKNAKTRIVWEGDIPDNTDDVHSTIDVPSWKRMCYCILKNDHECRFMGFGLTKKQQQRIAEIKRKYANI